MKNSPFWITLLACFWSVCGNAEEKKTTDEWKALAEQGNAEGQFHYSEALHTGTGVAADDFESARYVRLSAEQGFAKAQASFANRLKAGNGVEQDIVASVAWLEKAATQGDTPAQIALGLCYTNGDGTPRNEVAALRWLEKAAKAGSKFAENTLGSMALRNAPTTDADAAKAYEEAARRGDTTGIVAYAACLSEGRGVSKNIDLAAKWLTLAANKGDLLARYRLGLLYKENDKEPVIAYQWLSLVGEEGIASAKPMAETLAKKLSPEQLQKAQAWIKERAKPKTETPPIAGTPTSPSTKEPNLSALSGSGTGFFISEDGYLITNFHVVNKGRRFVVQKGEKKYPAKIIATSAADDLALLKAEGEFTALELLNSDGVALGDTVLTVGYPRPTIQGISPKLSRGEIGSLRGLLDNPRDFQVSLPLQPGNSGGPLVNKDGKVIGVVCAVLGLEQTQAVNYAIKSTHVFKLIQPFPDVSKRFPKPVENKDASFAVKQTEAASVLVWTYGE